MISTALIRNCAPTAVLAQQFAPRKQSIRQRYNPAAATLKRNFLRGVREGERRPQLHVFFVPLLSALGSPIKYAFGLRQASVEVEEVCLVQEMTGICPVPGQTSPAAGLCRGREVCLVQQMTGICPVPGQTSPAAAAAPKQAPVYRRAGWSNPNRRLFIVAQTGVNQTGACLPSRRLRSPKQAPVYRRADQSEPNRRLFTAAQIA